MIKQQLMLDGASYTICLPDAETDYIQGKIAKEKQPYEHEMLRDMAARVEKGDLVLDVGANIGNHTLYLASVAGCHVHAFEPNEHLCEALRQSVEINELNDKVVIHQVGVSAAKGAARFAHLNPSNLGAQPLERVQEEEKKGIRLIALDEMDWPTTVGLIKIDVEGMETDVIDGARRLIDRDKPLLYVESQTSGEFEPISRRLRELGYLVCTTFNATPTHFFQHHSKVSVAEDVPGFLVEKARQIYEFETRFVELRDKLAECNSKYRETSDRMKAIKEQRDNANAKYQEASAQIASLKLDIEKKQLAIQRLEFEGEKHGITRKLEEERALVQLERLKNNHKVELERRAFDRRKTDRDLSELRRVLSELQPRYESLQNELKKRNEQFSELNEQYSYIKAHEVPGLEEKLSVQSSRLKDLEDLLEQRTQEYTQTQSALNDEIQELHKRISSEQSEYKRLVQELEATTARLNEANLKYREATGQVIPQLKGKLEDQSQRSRELQQRTDQLNRELKQAREEKASAQRALSALRSSLTYKAGLHVRAARGSARDALKLPVRLLKLRRQIARETGSNDVNEVKHPVGLPPSSEADHAGLDINSLARKPTIQVRIACIMDDFTYGSYQPECDLCQLTPNNWKKELEAFQPEVLFIESAWRGKGELWGNKVGHCSQELQGIVTWCRERHIPTVFWNKEDPVHFETFLTTAQLFDFVFTTDMDCIHRYKAALGHEYVYLLPFACQPAVHNPIEKYERKDAFCFAGAYYVRYPERTKDLESFVRELPDWKPFEIYDRNYGKDDSNYQFPEAYQPHIVGTLPFSEIDKAYKGYRYAINLNSIKQSQTMFARRVYELLGSNTLTISNYSRGVRLIFGDLVVATDSGTEVRHRLEQLESYAHIDRLRLAGLRKVMREHTYATRLNYILAKITGQPRVTPLPGYTIIAKVTSQAEAEAAIANAARQQGIELELLLVCAKGLPVVAAQSLLANGPVKGSAVAQKSICKQTLQELVADRGHWISAMMPADYYGPNYLLDMALATLYSNARVIGKATFYQADGAAAPIQRHPGRAYQTGQPLAARRAVIHPDCAARQTAKDWLKGMASWTYLEPDQQAIDSFNYCQDAGATPHNDVTTQTDDLPVNQGTGLSELTSMAEAIAPLESDLEHAPWLDGHQFANLLIGKDFHWLSGNSLAESKDEERNIRLTRNKAITSRLLGPLLEVDSQLPDGKHDYLYAGKDLPLQTVQEQLVEADHEPLPMHLQTDPGLNLSLVVLYLDANKDRLGHAVLQANRNVNIKPVEGTRYLRFGLRIYAGGSSKIHRLVLGHLDLEPANILGQADVLLLTNHYPSYDDLYRNAFVHSRVKAYREHSVDVDVFRLRIDQPISWHEFHDIDVTTGSQQALRRMLASGRYRHVLVHFLDPDMWEVLQEFIGSIRVTVWVHGADIQPWYRRSFNFETLEQELAAKKTSEKRMSFWHSVLRKMPANLHMVFVSKTFAEEVMEDLGFRLPKEQFSVIHNPVDTGLFNYVEKDPEQRKKILSIRPYSSRVYANDLTVKCIRELANKPFFNELEFRIIGDGALFAETVRPLEQFDNVRIEKKFLTQHEIAELHKEYGLFLCPSRYDTQGVSRDEAMSSGLVPITNRAGAIPDFVNSECGFLCEPESAEDLACAITEVFQNPSKFSKMSKLASDEINFERSQKQIIPEEIGLLSI